MAEPQRLAQFLRDRCERNQYGLRYLNPEKTLLMIPWPVVPKPSEEQPAGFQMFHEWASLSFRKRGNNEAAEQRETPTQQKHRFRNALARANGIVYRRDKKIEGARVYEFVASKRAGSMKPSEANSPCSQDGSATDPDLESDDILDLFNSHRNVYNDGFYTNPQNLLNPMAASIPQNSPTHSDTSTIHTLSTPGFINHSPPNTHDLIDELFADGITEVMEESSRSDTNRSPLLPFAEPMSIKPQAPILNHGLSPASSNDQSELEIKLRFRDDEARRCNVTNQYGCRIYYGKNIPDLSQLLEKEHLDNVMSRFRYNQETYFGPESLQQIQLPRPNEFMKSYVQAEKSEQILVNMDRGLILCLDNNNAAQQINIPDVYAMRLCQTRIFPYREGPRPKNTFLPQPDTLRRMEWMKVFDGRIFCEQFVAADQMASHAAPYPSPSFAFSLGVRPSYEEHTSLLVTVTITVQKAQQLIQSRLDSDKQEICISGINSVDLEAKQLANRLTEILTLH